MAFTFKVKKRCRFCGKVLREDGTCQNPDCPRYVPDPEPTEPTEPKETPSEGTTTPSENNTTPAAETPSTGEPVQSDGESATNTNGNTETKPTP